MVTRPLSNFLVRGWGLGTRLGPSMMWSPCTCTYWGVASLYETGPTSFVPRLTVQRPGNKTRRKMSWRPWTAAAARLRHLKGHKRKPPEPITKWKIVRGDLVSFGPYLRMQLWKFQLKSTTMFWSPCMQVEVLCGKDRGKQGHVAVVARKLNKVVVQGLNTVVWHLP